MNVTRDTIRPINIKINNGGYLASLVYMQHALYLAYSGCPYILENKHKDYTDLNHYSFFPNGSIESIRKKIYDNKSRILIYTFNGLIYYLKIYKDDKILFSLEYNMQSIIYTSYKDGKKYNQKITNKKGIIKSLITTTEIGKMHFIFNLKKIQK